MTYLDPMANRSGALFVHIYKEATSIDLTVFPAVDETYEDDQYLMGDAHSNALYVLNSLLRKGIVTTSSEVYQKFVTLYYQHIKTMAALRANIGDLNAIKAASNEINEFHSLLAKIEINKQSLTKKIILHFLGDEVADRGADDAFILFLEEKLFDNGVNFKIYNSNHGLEFLKDFHKGEFGLGLGAYVSDSMTNLGLLIKLGIVSGAKINEIYRKIYFSRLHAMGYIVLSNNPKKIALITHAPTPWRIYQDTCELLGSPFNPVDLPHTIDEINSDFSEMIKDPKLINKYIPPSNSVQYNPAEPLDSSIWCRMEDDNDSLNQLRPPELHGIQYFYIHGHHGKGHVALHKIGYVFNLDGLLAMYDVTQGVAQLVVVSKFPPKQLVQQAATTTPQPSAISQPATTTENITINQLDLPLNVAGSVISMLAPNQGVNVIINGPQANLNSESTSSAINVYIGPNATNFQEINPLLAGIHPRKINLEIDNPNYFSVIVPPNLVESLFLKNNCILEHNQFEVFIKNQFKMLGHLTLQGISFKPDNNMAQFLAFLSQVGSTSKAHLQSLKLSQIPAITGKEFAEFVERMPMDNCTLWRLHLAQQANLFQDSLAALIKLVKTNRSIRTLFLPELKPNQDIFIAGIIDSYNTTITECFIGEALRPLKLSSTARNKDDQLVKLILMIEERWDFFGRFLSDLKGQLGNTDNDLKLLPEKLHQSEYEIILSFTENPSLNNTNEILLALFNYFNDLQYTTREIESELIKRGYPLLAFDSRSSVQKILGFYYDLLKKSLRLSSVDDVCITNVDAALNTLEAITPFSIINQEHVAIATMLYKRYLSTLLKEPATLFKALQTPPEEFEIAFIKGKTTLNRETLLTDEQPIGIEYLDQLFKKYVDIMLLNKQTNFESLITHVNKLQPLTSEQRSDLVRSLNQYFINANIKSEDPKDQLQGLAQWINYHTEFHEGLPLDNDTKVKLNILSQVINSPAFNEFILRSNGVFDYETVSGNFPILSAYKDDPQAKNLYYYQFILSWFNRYQFLKESPTAPRSVSTQFLLLAFDRANIYGLQILDNLKTSEYNASFLKLIQTTARDLVEQNQYKEAKYRIYRAFETHTCSEKDKDILLASINKQQMSVFKTELSSTISTFLPKEAPPLQEKIAAVQNFQGLIDLITTIRKEHSGILYSFFNTSVLDKIADIQKRVLEANIDLSSKPSLVKQ